MAALNEYFIGVPMQIVSLPLGGIDTGDVGIEYSVMAHRGIFPATTLRVGLE